MAIICSTLFDLNSCKSEPFKMLGFEPRTPHSMDIARRGFTTELLCLGCLSSCYKRMFLKSFCSCYLVVHFSFPIHSAMPWDLFKEHKVKAEAKAGPPIWTLSTLKKHFLESPNFSKVVINEQKNIIKSKMVQANHNECYFFQRCASIEGQSVNCRKMGQLKKYQIYK